MRKKFSLELNISVVKFSGAIDARSCFSSGEHSQANGVVIAFMSLCSRRESY